MSKQCKHTKTYKWQIHIWKDAQHYVSSGNYKLKQQCDATAIQSEWIKSKELTISNAGAGEDMEQQGLIFVATGNAKSHSHFGRQLGNSL